MANLADFVSAPPAFIRELLSPQTSNYYHLVSLLKGMNELSIDI